MSSNQNWPWPKQMWKTRQHHQLPAAPDPAWMAQGLFIAPADVTASWCCVCRSSDARKELISPCVLAAWKALMSQVWLVNKNPYIFSIQRTLNQPCKPQTPPTDCRCKPSQQLAKNVAYSVVWPILVSRSLLPTQLCPCCSTKMNWPSTLLLASFQQMLIHSAQGSGKLSRYFQTRCWCTSLHLNSECRPVQGAFKTNLPEQIWVGWWWYLNDLDEIIISDVDLAS